jgi:hypothetical protein
MSLDVPPHLFTAIDVGIAVADLDAAMAFTRHVRHGTVHEETSEAMGVREVVAVGDSRASSASRAAERVVTIAKFLDRHGPGLQQRPTGSPTSRPSRRPRERGVRLLYDTGGAAPQDRGQPCTPV